MTDRDERDGDDLDGGVRVGTGSCRSPSSSGLFHLKKGLVPGFFDRGWGDIPHSEPAKGAVSAALGGGWLVLIGVLLFVFPGIETWPATDLTIALILMSFVGMFAALPRTQTIRGVRATPEGLAVDVWLDQLRIPWAEVETETMREYGGLIRLTVWRNSPRSSRVLCLQPSTVRDLLSSPYSPPARPPAPILEMVGPPKD
jgi:hypothetical protein